MLAGGALIVVVAAACAVPFYIWSAVKSAILKEKFQLDNFYKYSFFAGFVNPFLLFASMAWLARLNVPNYFFMICLVVIPVISAEMAVRLSMIIHHNGTTANSTPVANSSRNS